MLLFICAHTLNDLTMFGRYMKRWLNDKFWTNIWIRLIELHFDVAFCWLMFWKYHILRRYCGKNWRYILNLAEYFSLNFSYVLILTRTSPRYWQISFLTSRGFAEVKSLKKLERVFIKHYAPNICLPMKKIFTELFKMLIRSSSHLTDAQTNMPPQLLRSWGHNETDPVSLTMQNGFMKLYLHINIDKI